MPWSLILEQRSQISAARGQYQQAGLPFNPTLQYQSQEIGNEGASGLHALQMNQPVVTANKLELAQQIQAQQVRRQQAQLRRAELQVLTDVRAAFITALVAQRRVELLRQIVDLAQQSVASVQALVDAQEVLKVALQRYRRLQQEVLPRSERTFQLSQQAFRAGETDYLPLLTAQRTLFTTRLSVLDAARETQIAAAQIDGLLVTLP